MKIYAQMYVEDTDGKDINEEESHLSKTENTRKIKSILMSISDALTEWDEPTLEDDIYDLGYEDTVAALQSIHKLILDALNLL